MTDSLADLLKRQQQSATPKAPEAPPPHDEAAEVAAIAKEQAAKAAVIAGRFLGKATVLGTKKTIEATQQAKQRLDAMTPEQRLAARQIVKRVGLSLAVFAVLIGAGYGIAKAWHAWHSAPVVAAKAKPAPTPTLKVQAQMPDGTVKTITIPATDVASASTVQPLPVPTPAPRAKVEVPATAVAPSTMTQQARVVAPSTTTRQAESVPSHQVAPQPSQGVNARYHHAAPVLNQQKYRPDPLLAPRHKENWFTQMAGQPNPVAKQHSPPPSSADPQEQKNMKALDAFFQQLNSKGHQQP